MPSRALPVISEACTSGSNLDLHETPRIDIVVHTCTQQARDLKDESRASDTSAGPKTAPSRAQEQKTSKLDISERHEKTQLKPSRVQSKRSVSAVRLDSYKSGSHLAIKIPQPAYKASYAGKKKPKLRLTPCTEDGPRRVRGPNHLPRTPSNLQRNVPSLRCVSAPGGSRTSLTGAVPGQASVIPREEIQRLRQKMWIGHKNTLKLFKKRKYGMQIGNTSKGEKSVEVAPLVRWRRHARVVQLMCGVCLALRKYSQLGYIDLEKIKTTGVATKRTLTTGKEGDAKEEEIIFNPDDFKTNYEATWPAELKHVVEKWPKDRTDEDHMVIKRVLRGLHSFRKYTKEMQNLLSKVVRYCRYGPKRVIIRKGHVGHSFYFVFSGAVQVVFDKEDISVFTKPEISVLKKGDVFGEIALLRHSVRNATIVCAEETELLAVDREEFNEYGLFDLFMKECQHRIDFLRKQPVFSAWPKQSIEDLCYVSRIEEYGYNKVIVRDARKSEWLYFVSKGCCEILRLVDLSKCEEFKQFVPPEPQLPTNDTRTPPVFLDMDSALQYLKKNWVPPRSQEQVKANLELALQSDSSLADRSRLTISIVVESHGSGDSKTLSGRDSSAESRPRSRHPSHSVKPVNSQKFSIASHAASAAISLKKQRKAVFTEPVADFDNVGIGVFIRVDNLRPGDVFGLSTLFEKPQFISLVSKGAEVIRVPRQKFKQLGGEVTLRKAREMIKTYPPDADLCRNFLQQNTWNMFKQDLVDIVRSDFPNAPAPSGPQRGTKDYFRRVTTNAASQRFPLPRILYSPEQMIGQLTNGDKYHVRAKSASSRLGTGAPFSTAHHVTAISPRYRPKTAGGARTTRGIFPVSTISSLSSSSRAEKV